MKRGKFIVFEGLDKAGKTTLAKIVVDKNKNFIYQKGLCSNTWIGRIAKKHPSTFLFLLELFWHSLFNYFKLLKGLDIVQDRYLVSISSHIPVSKKVLNRALIRFFSLFLMQPDILVYCTVSKKERIKRLRKDSLDNKHHLWLLENHQYIDKRDKEYEKYFQDHKNKKILINTSDKYPYENILEISSLFDYEFSESLFFKRFHSSADAP